MIQKFRKKPVVVEAVQFTDEKKNMVLNDVRQWQQNVYPSITAIDREPILIIPTLEGEMTASLNDWIIRGVNGEVYPCKPDIFEKTYEPA